MEYKISRPKKLVWSGTALLASVLVLGTASAAETAAPKPALVGLPFNATFASINYQASVYVADGQYLADKSTPSEVSGGPITASGASGLSIAVHRDRSGGLYVAGKSDFTLTDSHIEVFGNSAGWDENFGVGAGATVGLGANLTLRHVSITTHGIKATPTVGAGGTLRVYDSTLIAKGGDVPAENLIPGTGPGYVGPPEALDIRGSARGSNVVGDGKAYYYNSTIISEGWGSMSTDSANPTVYLEVNNCRVENHHSGYGTYADNGAEVVINHSHFSSASDTGIISGNGKITLNDVDEDTAINGVMIHAPGRDFTRVATLTIQGGRYRTREAVVLVKSHNADIVFDGANLQPRNGVLLQSEVNSSKRSALMQWLLSAQKPADVVTGPVTGIRASFRNVPALHGNIVHGDTTRTMTLSFEHSHYQGAITGSVWAITDVHVKMLEGASWMATANSQVTLEGSSDERVFDAPRGVTITALAGDGTTLRGRYPLKHGGELLVKSAS